MDNIELVFNETTQKWEERTEPFITVEIETEEDYEFLRAAVEYYGNRDKHVEVVHGRWEKAEYHGFLRCSACKDCYISDEWIKSNKWNYCPNCGAKMDKNENT